MSAEQQLSPIGVSRATNMRPVWSTLGRKLTRVLRALAAGMAASKDYRHLNGMTDRQLRALGVARDDIPRELHRRHFASLAGPGDSIR